jgi:hypothetical protein
MGENWNKMAEELGSQKRAPWCETNSRKPTEIYYEENTRTQTGQVNSRPTQGPCVMMR